MRNSAVAILVAFVLALAVAPDRPLAGETGEFNAAVADAYGHYRQAVFFLRTKNPGVAALEISLMADKWQALTDTHAKSPPDAYDGDSLFQGTMRAVSELLAKAQTAAEAMDGETAAEAMKPVRAMLSELRRRSGIVTFSDCVDAINASMDRLWPYRHNPPDFENAEAVDALRQELGISLYLYRKCYAEAPQAYREDEEFQRLFENGIDSFTRIWEPVREKNAVGVINFLRELRSLDKMIFLRFG